MERFFETNISEPQTNDEYTESIGEDERKVELIPRELSHGDKIEVGKNTLTYLENDTSNHAKKALERIEHFKKIYLLPQEIRPEYSYLINEKDGGRFTALSTPEHSIYFVKFRTLKVGDISESAENFETISTSQCIFGHGSTKAKLEDGSSAIFRQGILESEINSDPLAPRPITGWDIDDRISIYELEALYRNISFINALASDDTRFNKVILNIPRVEYYLCGLDYYQKGLLSGDLLQEWFHIIDKRTDRLNKLTDNRLLDRYSIFLKSPLDELRSYIINQVTSNSSLVLEDALEILSQDRLWLEIINVKRPISWLDLVETAIASEELRNSFESGSGTAVVKSPKQESTFYRSRDIAKLLHSAYGDNFNLVAMYPHERIIVTHDTPKRTLLSYIPEPMTISSAKSVIRQYNLKKD